MRIYWIAQRTLLRPKWEVNLKKKRDTHITDSFCYIAETNTVCKQLYADKN